MYGWNLHSGTALNRHWRKKKKRNFVCFLGLITIPARTKKRPFINSVHRRLRWGGRGEAQNRGKNGALEDRFRERREEKREKERKTDGVQRLPSRLHFWGLQKEKEASNSSTMNELGRLQTKKKKRA